jgi:serine/threonine protein kinase/Tol biopolymer transport system component
MTPERFARIGQLYSEAAELAPETRAAYLAQACAGDDDLRREVESLLAEEDLVGDFMGSPALRDAATLVTSEVPGTLVGKQLGHYQLISFIGAGGMGEVYAARDTRIGRKVAVKLLPSAVARDADRLRRFEQEVRAVGMLNHPNILTIHDVGTHEGAPYLVSELLEGETLRERLKNEALPLSKAMDIALQITRGLAAAHDQGLVHRDLKPENLFIIQDGRDGRVKILDFGLAKLSQSRTSGANANEPVSPAVATNPGMVMGTVSYMAPEQLHGEAVDCRADIFAFGVILYEMLAGERPFRGVSTAETMSAIITRDAPDLPAAISAQAPGLARLIHRCLEKQVQHRFQSASDLGFALEALTMSVLSSSGAAQADVADAAASQIAPTPRLKPDVGKPSVRRMNWLGWAGWVMAGVFLIATVGLSVSYLRHPPVSPRVVPFTSVPGQKSSPVFSPDGNQIAFIWDGGESAQRGVYVKLIGEGAPLRVASNPGFQLAWSPGGRSIAFDRMGNDGGIFAVPATGGPERRLTELSGPFAWSPDQKTLAIARRNSPQDPAGIVLLTLETGVTNKLTNPPAGSVGDQSPAFSPDGQKLAFIRSPGTQVGDIHIVPITGGEPQRLTSDNLFLGGGLAWTADGREIVFSSTRGGLPTLWRVQAAGGRLRRLIGIGEYAHQPAISRVGGRLAYLYRKTDTNIWRAPGPLSTAPASDSTRLVASTREESNPQFSFDGNRIVFISDRSGSREIWVCDSDGRNPVQLTSFGGSHTGSPRWSPDGRQLAFDSRPAGLSSIYVTSVAGGSPRRLTDGKSEDVLPSWSRDGRWIYFSSRRSGDWQIWRTTAAGDQVEQVTRNGGYEAFEAADGKTLYYAKREPGVWRMSLSGGEETRILEQGNWGYWALLEQGICFLNQRALPQPTLEFFNFATSQVTLFGRLERGRAFGSSPGVAVSQDGRWILYSQVDQNDNDIMLVENFR